MTPSWLNEVLQSAIPLLFTVVCAQPRYPIPSKGTFHELSCGASKDTGDLPTVTHQLGGAGDDIKRPCHADWCNPETPGLVAPIHFPAIFLHDPRHMSKIMVNLGRILQVFWLSQLAITCEQIWSQCIQCMDIYFFPYIVSMIGKDVQGVVVREFATICHYIQCLCCSLFFHAFPATSNNITGDLLVFTGYFLFSDPAPGRWKIHFPHVEASWNHHGLPIWLATP